MIKTYFSLILVFLTSCSTVNNYVSHSALDSCPIKMDDEKFNERVSDSYDDRLIVSAMEYEKMINSRIVREIYEALDAIKAKQTHEENIESVATDVVKLMKSEIKNHKAIAEYIKQSDSLDYGISSKDRVVNFIGKVSVENIERGISLFSKYKKDFILGSIPKSMILDGDRVYFCKKEKNIISGDVDINAVLHILHSVYATIDQNGFKAKIKGKSFISSSYSFKVLPLPRKFVVSDAYLQTQNSIYVDKLNNVNSYGFILANVAYDEIYEFSKKARKEFSDDIKYSPWYSQLFNINSRVNQERMLAFYRIKNGEDYIAANIANSIADYSDFITNFDTVKITNDKKQIKPGQIILFRDFVKTSTDVDQIVNGNDGTIGLIMDYDPIDKTALILTDRENVGSKKVGLGFDVVSLNSSIVNRKYFIFTPKKGSVDFDKKFSNNFENSFSEPNGPQKDVDEKNAKEMNQIAQDDYNIVASDEVSIITKEHKLDDDKKSDSSKSLVVKK